MAADATRHATLGTVHRDTFLAPLEIGTGVGSPALQIPA